jgi:hypothetical protein
MILGVTGHRPDKLPDKMTGYKLPNPTYNFICSETEKFLLKVKPDKIVTGMALGYDQYVANIAIKLKIPFLAAIPFEDQDEVWPNKSKEIYSRLLDKASEVVCLYGGKFSASKLLNRNRFIVDISDVMLACYNKSGLLPIDNNLDNESLIREHSGTGHCVKYVIESNKPIFYINPITKFVSNLDELNIL